MSESALDRLESALADLALFVTERFQQQQSDTTSDHRPAAVPPRTPHCDVIESFALYVRSVVRAAESNLLNVGAPDHSVRAACRASGDDGRNLVSESVRLRQLVTSLSTELTCELEDRRFLAAEYSRVAQMLDDVRQEDDVVSVFKRRINELQGGNTAAAPGPGGAAASSSSTSSSRAIANELGRLTLKMKDKMERMEVEALKAQTDRTALIAENAILFDRVKVLEHQLAALSASTSNTMRELSRQRVRHANSMAEQSGSHQPPPRRSMSRQGGVSSNITSSSTATTLPSTVHPHQSSTTSLLPDATSITIGDVVIERDVALWMKDLYLSLLKDPETSSMMPTPPLPPQFTVEGKSKNVTTAAGQQQQQSRPSASTPGGTSAFAREQQQRRSGSNSALSRRSGGGGGTEGKR